MGNMCTDCPEFPLEKATRIPYKDGAYKLRTVRGVCMFLPLDRALYQSISSTTSVHADSSILEEVDVMWSQSCATEITRCHVSGMQ